MCSKFLKHDADKRGLAHRIDVTFDKLRSFYLRLLSASLRDRAATVVFGLIVLIAMGGLGFITMMSKELAPSEDQGAAFIIYNGPTNANLDYMDRYGDAMKRGVQSIPELDGFFTVNGTDGTNNGFGVAVMKTWSERERAQGPIIGDLTASLSQISGLNTAVIAVPPIPGVDGIPIQLVINTTADYRTLNDVVTRFMDALKARGMQIFYSDVDLKFEKPQTIVEIDRDKAAAYGVTMSEIARTLATMTGGNFVNLINLYNKSYQVIPQVARVDRLDPSKLGEFYVKASNGEPIPLASLVSFRQEVQPISLNQFNQQNAAMISMVAMGTLGESLATMQEVAAEVLPEGFTIDYAGQSRQYIQEGNAFFFTIAFAIIIIYLVLAAQFESLRDPLVIMISVPLSICGALIPLALGFSTMNIYSQVGLVTLVGLITKHGILICEVAKEQQEKFGLSKLEAVETAAGLRLRPVLMTTAAMVAGLIPLMFASGAGAASRMSIAIVIIAGMSIGTLFTLFVLPVFYTFLASNHAKKPGANSQQPMSSDGLSHPATLEG